MRYMLSACVNVPVELAQVSSVLQALAGVGEVLDVSLALVPGEHEQAHQHVATGTDPVTVVAPATPRRRQRVVASNDDNRSVVGLPTAASPTASQVLAGSDNTGASTATRGPGVATVGESGGAYVPPAESLAADGAPPPNVISVEEVRAYAAKIIQADGARRPLFNRKLAEYGVKGITGLSDEARVRFYDEIKKEYGE